MTFQKDALICWTMLFIVHFLWTCHCDKHKERYKGVITRPQRSRWTRFLGPVVLRCYKACVWSALHADLLCNTNGYSISKSSTLPERETIVWRPSNSLISSINVLWLSIMHQALCKSLEKEWWRKLCLPLWSQCSVTDTQLLISELLCIYACFISHSAVVADTHHNYKHIAPPIFWH